MTAMITANLLYWLGGPDNSLSGSLKATGSDPQVTRQSIASCALRAPGQHTHVWRCRATQKRQTELILRQAQDDRLN